MAKLTETHKDVEYHIDEIGGGTFITHSFDKASAYAVRQSIDLGEKWTNVDVVVWSEAGAKWWGGDEGVRRYHEDPEASVFDRLVVKAQSQGMIP